MLPLKILLISFQEPAHLPSEQLQNECHSGGPTHPKSLQFWNSAWRGFSLFFPSPHTHTSVPLFLQLVVVTSYPVNLDYCALQWCLSVLCCCLPGLNWLHRTSVLRLKLLITLAQGYCICSLHQSSHMNFAFTPVSSRNQYLMPQCPRKMTVRNF